MAPNWAEMSTRAAALRAGTLLWHLRPLDAVWRLEVGSGVHVEGTLWLPGEGRVVLGRRVRLLGARAPIELRAHPGGEIFVEDDVVLESGASIEATRSVRVGAGARIGAFSKILDNNFHRTSGDRRERPTSIPIVIAAGAVVGPRAVLLPGASLGPDARVAPGRVVSFHVPAGVDQSQDPRERQPNTPRVA
jgi:acetyltransferase-like isoleucine patch superfamily enzyme